jgi:hypothetical protein
MDHLTVEKEPDFVRRGKNLLCFFKAKYLSSPVPDMEGYEMEGHFRKWIKRRLKSRTRMNYHLFSSIFKAKNAAPALTFDTVEANGRKHRASVSKPDTATPVDCEAAVSAIRPMLDSITRKMKAAVRDSLKFESIAELSCSSKSCYERSNARGGLVGELVNECFGDDSYLVAPGLRFENYPSREFEFVKNEDFYPEFMEGVYGQKPHPLFQKMKKQPVNGRLPKSVKNRRYKNEPFTYEYYEERLDFAERQEDPVPQGLDRIVDKSGNVEYRTRWHYPESEAKWNQFVEEMCLEEYMDGEMPHAKVAFVCEPFKVRIITKSEARRQYCLRWFQKTLHSIMKEYWCFQLMGCAPTTAMLSETAKYASTVGTGELGHESSDFSGASDGTPERLVQGVLEPVLTVLPIWMAKMARVSNGRHIIEYPEKYEGKVFRPLLDDVEQNRGTLMGRITSFPVLCLMVLAAHVWNLRECGDNRPFWDLVHGVLINGDDRYTVSRRSTYESFWKHCERLQFSESVGKSYFDYEYANINSQSYILKLSSPSLECWKIPVFPLGLFAGRKKIKGEDFNPEQVLNDVLGGCLGPKMERQVCCDFLRRWKKEIDRNLCGRNLFLPYALGGAGQRPPRLGFGSGGGLWKVRLTMEQQVVASALFEEGACDEFPPRRPYVDDLAPAARPAWDVEGNLTFWEMIRQLQQGVDCDPEFDFWEYYQRRGVHLTMQNLISRKRLSRMIVTRTSRTPTFGTWICPCCEEPGNRGLARCSICTLELGVVAQPTYELSADLPLHSLSDALERRISRSHMSRDIGYYVFLEKSKRLPDVVVDDSDELRTWAWMRASRILGAIIPSHPDPD